MIIKSLYKISSFTGKRYFSSIEKRIKSIGYVLPKAPPAKGAYSPLIRSNNIVYLSGHLPINHDGTLIRGTVDKYLNNTEGKDAALICGLNILSTLKNNVGLENIEQIIKLVGYINCSEDYESHPYIMDGCSNLFLKVFGEKGVHARSTVGVKTLPFNVPIEIEGIIKLKS